jgi:hypothetical protein
MADEARQLAAAGCMVGPRRDHLADLVITHRLSPRDPLAPVEMAMINAAELF